jgi:hypothetical protein
MRSVTHTTGGTSAIVAMKSQMTPLQTERAFQRMINIASRKKRRHSYLFPHEASQTIHARFVEA